MAAKTRKRQSKSQPRSRSAANVTVRRRCGAMEAHMRLLEEDPGMRERRAEIHAEASRMIQSPTMMRRAAKKGPTTIPVVVHVVYKTAAENISVAQIASQIAALNRDYSAANPDKTT